MIRPTDCLSLREKAGQHVCKFLEPERLDQKAIRLPIHEERFPLFVDVSGEDDYFGVGNLLFCRRENLPSGYFMHQKIGHDEVE